MLVLIAFGLHQLVCTPVAEVIAGPKRREYLRDGPDALPLVLNQRNAIARGVKGVLRRVG